MCLISSLIIYICYFKITYETSLTASVPVKSCYVFLRHFFETGVLLNRLRVLAVRTVRCRGDAIFNFLPSLIHRVSSAD